MHGSSSSTRFSSYSLCKDRKREKETLCLAMEYRTTRTRRRKSERKRVSDNGPHSPEEKVSQAPQRCRKESHAPHAQDAQGRIKEDASLTPFSSTRQARFLAARKPKVFDKFVKDSGGKVKIKRKRKK